MHEQGTRPESQLTRCVTGASDTGRGMVPYCRRLGGSWRGVYKLTQSTEQRCLDIVRIIDSKGPRFWPSRLDSAIRCRSRRFH